VTQSTQGKLRRLAALLRRVIYPLTYPGHIKANGSQISLTSVPLKSEEKAAVWLSILLRIAIWEITHVLPEIGLGSQTSRHSFLLMVINKIFTPSFSLSQSYLESLLLTLGNRSTLAKRRKLVALSRKAIFRLIYHGISTEIASPKFQTSVLRKLEEKEATL